MPLLFLQTTQRKNQNLLQRTVRLLGNLGVRMERLERMESRFDRNLIGRQAEVAHQEGRRPRHWSPDSSRRPLTQDIVSRATGDGQRAPKALHRSRKVGEDVTQPHMTAAGGREEVYRPSKPGGNRDGLNRLLGRGN